MASPMEAAAAVRAQALPRATEALQDAVVALGREAIAQAPGSWAPQRGGPPSIGRTVTAAVEAGQLLAAIDPDSARSTLQPFLRGGGGFARLAAAGALVGTVPADDVVPILEHAAVEDVGGAGTAAVAALAQLHHRAAVEVLVRCSHVRGVAARVAIAAAGALAAHPLVTDDDVERCLALGPADDRLKIALLRAVEDPRRRARLVEGCIAARPEGRHSGSAMSLRAMFHDERWPGWCNVTREVARIEAEVDGLLVLVDAAAHVDPRRGIAIEAFDELTAICIELARSADPRASPALARLLRREDLPSELFEHAATIIREVGDHAAVAVAMEVARSRQDVQESVILRAAGAVGGAEALAMLRPALASAERWSGAAASMVELCVRLTESGARQRPNRFVAGSDEHAEVARAIAGALRRHPVRRATTSEVRDVCRVLHAVSAMAVQEAELRTLSIEVASEVVSSLADHGPAPLDTLAFAGLARTLSRAGDERAAATLEALCRHALDQRRGSDVMAPVAASDLPTAIESLIAMGPLALAPMAALAGSSGLTIRELRRLVHGADLAERELVASAARSCAVRAARRRAAATAVVLGADGTTSSAIEAPTPDGRSRGNPEGVGATAHPHCGRSSRDARRGPADGRGRQGGDARSDDGEHPSGLDR